MAQASNRRLTCKITDVKGEAGIYVVGVEFNNGDTAWHQGFRMAPEAAWSLNDFQTNLLEKMQRGEIQPPADMMHELKEAIGESFVMDIEAETNVKA